MPGQDYCLAEQRAALGSADVEGITETGEVGECYIVLLARQAIGEPCAVDIKRNIVLAAGFADLRQFLQ